ncbi:hypothetical protein PCASD_14843, partial [Puccinia coronata f. sp. avenae]
MTGAVKGTRCTSPNDQYWSLGEVHVDYDAILLYLGLVITGRSPADSISKKNEIFRLPNTNFWFCQYLLKQDTISCQYLEFCGGPRDTRKIQPARQTAPKRITNWVLETYDCTAECLRIQDPKDASRSMRLTPTLVLGLNKGVVAATLDSRSQAGTSKLTKGGVSKSTKGGASKSPKSREKSNGQGPKDPKDDSKRRKQVFTPMQILPNGRVMAPRSIKAVEAEARR